MQPNRFFAVIMILGIGAGTCGVMLAYVLGVASARSEEPAGGGSWQQTRPAEDARTGGQQVSPVPAAAPRVPTMQARNEPAETVSAPREARQPKMSQALRYALAVRDGETSTVIEMTRWMQDRLQRVRLESGDSPALATARNELQERISARRQEDALLQEEGVEDRYLFMPGCELSIAAMDKGDPTLGTPVRERTWINVVYPDPANSLRDAQGRPIRSLRAGINLDMDGRVLKAGIVGNANIDRDSIGYDWPAGPRTAQGT